jgi:DNA mismatch endonuclease (patch repair protein)
MDTVSDVRRSQNMSRIRGKDTTAERAVRSALFKAGLRYRINVRALLGKPDIVLKKYSVAVFVNGCFWHRHPGCQLAYTPKTHVQFWETKFDRNVERDAQVTSQLGLLGWRCMTIWECETGNPVRLAELVQAITEGQRPRT